MRNRINKHTNVIANRFPVHDGSYRVVVLKNPESVDTHDRVLALCVEQDLVGRGPTIPDAMRDLARTLVLSIIHEFTELIPEYGASPDPAIEQVFNRAAEEFDGASVLRRMRLRVQLWKEFNQHGTQKKQDAFEPAEVSFEPALVA